MSRFDPNDLLERYIREVWNEGDPAAVARFVTAGYRRHVSVGSEPLGLQAQITRLQGFRAAFPDVTIEVEDVVASDDRIAFRGAMRGTHRGEFMGIPPSGRPFRVAILDIMRIEDGLIAAQWGGPDLLDLVRQLGGVISAGD